MFGPSRQIQLADPFHTSLILMHQPTKKAQTETTTHFPVWKKLFCTWKGKPTKNFLVVSDRGKKAVEETVQGHKKLKKK